MNASAPILRRSVIVAVTIASFTIAGLPVTAVRGAQGNSVRVENFSLRPGGEVRVENARGATRVESWDSASVRVVAEKKTPVGSSLEPNEMVMMGAGNALIIECRQSAMPARIDLTLYVPKQSQLELNGGAFPVDVSGSLLGATVETTSGAIGYRLPTSDDAIVEARTMQGVVRSTVPLAEVERSGVQMLRGQLGKGDSQIILNSQSGNISLSPGAASSRLARSASAPAATRAGGSPAGAQQSSDQSQTGYAGTTAGRSRAGTAPAPQQNNNPSSTGAGSIDLGGVDRGDDGSGRSRSGPFEREHQQRNSAGGNSGLRARIIPPGSPIPASGGGNSSGADQTTDDQDQSAGSSTSSSGQQMPPDPTVSSSGSGAVFAGADVGDSSDSNSKIGPFDRERRARNTGGGNSGLRVRIIPSGQALGSRDSDNNVFPSPSQDQGVNQSPPPRNTRSQIQYGSLDNSQVGSTTQPRGASRVPLDTSDLDSPSAGGSGSGAPPVLRRGADVDSGAPSPAAARRNSDSDEEAITLKAALVNLNVSVTNHSGLALGNLKKEEFQVAENGEQQRIEFFAASNAPFNLVLLIDLSGSIKDKLEVIKSAALKFLDVLGPQDKVAVVSFTDQIRVVSQLTSDRDELKRRIRAIERPQGGTAFYEAVWFSAVETLRGTQGQRNAIVVLSDGVDSSMDRYNPLDSRVSFPQLSRRIEESDVIVFPIYLDTEYEEVFERGNSTSEAYAVSRDQLARLAEVSGGQMFKAEKAGDLTNVYKQVAAAIRTVYSIGYQPTNSEKDGTFRRIRVTVNRGDAAVRTRKGYYAK